MDQNCANVTREIILKDNNSGSSVNTPGDQQPAARAQAPPDHPEEKHRGARLAGGRHLTQAALGRAQGDRFVILLGD